MVTVVVPAYNAEKAIVQCVRSILNQTYRDIEVIVVDDGSRDRTAPLVKKMQDQDNRIRLVSKENGGASSARNLGINEAKGEYLVFVDADDEILPDMLQSLWNAREEYDADLVKTALIRVSNDGSEAILSSKEKQVYLSKDAWKENFFALMENELNSPVAKLYKKAVLDEYHITFNENLELSEDLHFNLQYLEKINRVVFLPDAYYKYYLFNSDVTTRYRENLFMRRKESISLYDDFLRRNGINRDIVPFLYIKLLFSEAISEREHKTPKEKRISRIKSNLEQIEIQTALKRAVTQGATQKALCAVCKTRNALVIDWFSGVLAMMKKRKLGKGVRKVSV